MRILLAEDDNMIGAAVRDSLHQDGYAVDWLRDGLRADAALATGHYDLILLDLGLPGKDGLDLLRGLRRRRNTAPVIVITARDAIESRIAGLDAGADDYIVKPFDLDELAARIRAVHRRYAGRADRTMRAGGIVFDPATRRVTVGGKEVALSARELALLEALIDRAGAVLSRAQLEERIYGWGEEVESNAVEVHVHGLRKKLGAKHIRTIRGVGYTLRTDDEIDPA